MAFFEQSLGKNVRFLLPSLKLKQPCPGGMGITVEQSVHEFLMANFGGYTATAANLFGYWKDDDGRFSYGEHREFTVALTGESGLTELKQFLGETARTLDEKCLYVDIAGVALLLYGAATHAKITVGLNGQPTVTL